MRSSAQTLKNVFFSCALPIRLIDNGRRQERFEIIAVGAKAAGASWKVLKQSLRKIYEKLPSLNTIALEEAKGIELRYLKEHEHTGGQLPCPTD